MKGIKDEDDASVQAQLRNAMAVSFFCRTNFSVYLSSEQSPHRICSESDTLQECLFRNSRPRLVPAFGVLRCRKSGQKDWCDRKIEIAANRLQTAFRSHPNPTVTFVKNGRKAMFDEIK